MSLPTLLQPGMLRGFAAEVAGPDTVPVDYIIGWIKKRMPEFGARRLDSAAHGARDRLLIVRARTGSGKSTALPAHVFRILRDPRSRGAYGGRSVICTQPRVLTAVKLARDLAGSPHFPDLVLRETLGYQTGPIGEAPARGLIYATAGVLLQQLRLWAPDEVGAQYHTIIVDEVHERSLDTDVLLMRLKLLLAHPRAPFVILASATIDIAPFADYFGVGPENTVEVEGYAHPVIERFPKVGTNNYLAEAARVALAIHADGAGDPPGRGDILIFVPGARESADVVGRLRRAAAGPAGVPGPHISSTDLGAGPAPDPADSPGPFTVLEINGDEVRNEGADFRRLGARSDARRIIVATAIAETGVTIESLKYVVDSGWSREVEAYPPKGIEGLITRPAPQSRILQRRGRVGRLFPGEFFPLYTRGTFEALDAQQPPEIVARGVAPAFLDIARATAEARAGVFRVGDLDLLDPPPADALAEALETAVVCGFLAPAPGGHRLTPPGEIAAHLGDLGGGSAAMGLARLLLGGYLWRVSLLDLATVAAFCDPKVGDLYAKNRGRPRPGTAKPETPPWDLEALLSGLPDHFLSDAAHVAPPRAPPAAAATLTSAPLIRDAAAASDTASGGALSVAGPLPPGPREQPYYRARLLLADDFLESLLVFEGFAKALEGSGGDVASLRSWCDARGLERSRLLTFAAWREEIINQAIVAGINPFWGAEYRLVEAAPAAFGDIVVRLKHCIFEAFRRNLLTFDPRTATYRTTRGDVVDVPPRFEGQAVERLRGLGVAAADLARLQRPALLVADRLIIRRAQGMPGTYVPDVYRLSAHRVSVLDGFVAPDPTFFAPRRVSAP